MKTLKQILTYLIWIAISLLLGIVYMRMVLGPNHISDGGVWYLLHLFYDYALFHIGVRVGAVIALLFILLDIFLLQKMLKHSIKSRVIRLGLLLLITALVAGIHYVLEKVIDVI